MNWVILAQAVAAILQVLLNQHSTPTPCAHIETDDRPAPPPTLTVTGKILASHLDTVNNAISNVQRTNTTNA